MLICLAYPLSIDAELRRLPRVCCLMFDNNSCYQLSFTGVIMKRLALTFATLSAFLAGGAVAQAASVWNMATPYPDATFHTKNDRWLAKTIGKETNGKLVIHVHSNGSLVKHPQIKQAVQTGQVQMGEVLISILSNENPVYAADSIPFLATSYAQAHALWKAQRPVVKKLLAQQNLMLLYAEPWPPQGLYSAKPVKNLNDMKGVKFRAYNAETARLAKLMGATPTQVEVPDVPQAFSTGIVQAMITSPSTGVNTQAWDYVHYYYPLNAWIPKNMVFVNKQAFESLPASERKAVLKAAHEAEQRGWKMSEEEAKSKTQTLKQHGIKVIQPSTELKTQLEKIGKTMVKDWLAKAGAQGQKIIKTYRSEQ